MNEERRRATDELWEEKFKGVHNEIQSLGKLLTVQLNNILEQTIKTNGTVENHGTRINSLENWRWYIVGGLSVIAVIIVYIAR